MPVFAGRLRMEHLRDGVCRPALVEDAVGGAGEGIGAVAVGEGEIIGGKQMLVLLVVRSGRRGKAMIKKPQAAAGDVRDHAVKNLSPLLIGIEAIPEKVPQAAAALRRAKGQRPID